MKFPFKKVGDTFSVDEYNAMCYLLASQEYKEPIYFEKKAKHYKYGVYKFSDPNNILISKDNGFIIRKGDKPFKLTLAHSNPTANFYIDFKVARQKTITENGITSILYPYDLVDKLDESLDNGEFDISYETIRVKSDKVDEFTNVIEFVPEDYDLLPSDFISYDAHMVMLYDEPEINYEDGRAVDTEQIICNDFNDVYRAIISAPPESNIHLRLKGATTYTFNRLIPIDNKKLVYIEGGNIDSESHSILDGQDLYQLFRVHPDSLLDIQNCKFYRGNAIKQHPNNITNRTGGAITMMSSYENKGDYNGLHVSYVNLTNCIFENCKAERGGAIYNMRGKLGINNCDFINCRATSETNPQGAFGGAVHTTSISLYNNSTNQIQVNRSELNISGTTSSILLNIRSTQNITYFTNNEFTLNNLILHYKGNQYPVITTKINQYNYTLSIPVAINKDDTFYFTTNQISDHPSLSTHLLKAINEGNRKYVVMV